MYPNLIQITRVDDGYLMQQGISCIYIPLGSEHTIIPDLKKRLMSDLEIEAAYQQEVKDRKLKLPKNYKPTPTLSNRYSSKED